MKDPCHQVRAHACAISGFLLLLSDSPRNLTVSMKMSQVNRLPSKRSLEYLRPIDLSFYAVTNGKEHINSRIECFLLLGDIILLKGTSFLTVDLLSTLIPAAYNALYI